MIKEISAAVLYTNNRFFLAVHPTNKDYWDLPKGLVDKGESFLDAAAREFEEETGVILDKTKLQYYRKHPLHTDKDIYIYIYVETELPALSTFKCKSMTDAYGDPAPEVDKFTYFKLTDYSRMRNGFQKPLRDVLAKIKGDTNV